MLIETLKELCALPGVSSHEDAVRAYIRERIAAHADSIRVDAMGNLIVEKKGTISGAKKLMLAAHMDEVGLMIHTITDDGYLKFANVGGIDRRVLIGDFSTRLFEHLKLSSNGFSPDHDKSPADEIYSMFGVSKKVFKQAIGDLYKKDLIKIKPNGIELTIKGKATGIEE